MPAPLGSALEALSQIAEDAALSCFACRDMRQESAGGRWPDFRVERTHRRHCPGEHAWNALHRIARAPYHAEMVEDLTALRKAIGAQPSEPTVDALRRVIGAGPGEDLAAALGELQLLRGRVAELERARDGDDQEARALLRERNNIL